MRLFTKERIEHITDYLRYCFKNIPLWSGDTFMCDSWTVDDFLSNMSLPFPYDFEYGATKLVIIPCDEDYVIKIPFNTTEDGELFEAAPYGEWNYCESEMSLYEEAKERGFGEMFKPLFQVIVNPYPVYFQEKVVCFYDSDLWHSKKRSAAFLKEIKTTLGKKGIFTSRLEENWRADCVEFLGSIERFEEFWNFLLEFGMADDLHSANVGYTAEETPIILDYAGYNEGFQLDQQE